MTNLNVDTVRFIIDKAHELQMLGTDSSDDGLDRLGAARD